MTAPDMLAAALSAYDAGLQVIQVKTDHSKTPVSVADSASSFSCSNWCASSPEMAEIRPFSTRRSTKR